MSNYFIVFYNEHLNNWQYTCQNKIKICFDNEISAFKRLKEIRKQYPQYKFKIEQND